jgi:hypothetical protein
MIVARGVAISQSIKARHPPQRHYMNEWNPLAASELLADRPFTNPEHTWDDARAIGFALERLRALVHIPPPPNTRTPIPQIYWLETNGRIHRLIISNAAALRSALNLTLVGFFGQRRPNADPAPVSQIDSELIDELGEHPGLLSYCSLLMENGDYGNIVLFASSEAKSHWATSSRHAYAVRVISPKYYATVRLHNGVIPGGLVAGAAPIVESTKYLDYRPMLPWRGIRTFSPPAITA